MTIEPADRFPRSSKYNPGWIESVCGCSISAAAVARLRFYLNYLARFVKPGAPIGIAGAGLTTEIDGAVPAHLQAWWEPSLACLHTAKWWQRHWERSRIVDVELTDAMPDGWMRWLEWQHTVALGNRVEIEAVTQDRGRHLG